MIEKNMGREPDELYVPTPEELERGIEPGARERKRTSLEEAGKRGRLSDLARRLFRLRPSVGRERSEAPAPTPPPTTPDPSPLPSATDPQPASGRKADTPPTPLPSAATPQRSQEPQPYDQRATLRKPVEASETPPSSSATTSKQRLRRVVIPGRPRQPVEQPASSPVPEWVLEKARQKGHRLGLFREQRRALASEQDRRYVSQCDICKGTAYATNAAPAGWTIRDAGSWVPQGAAFEKTCRGNSAG